MSKFTFTYETRQIMTYEVEADSEEQARTILDQADDMEDFLADEDYNPDWPEMQPDPLNPEIYVLEEVK